MKLLKIMYVDQLGEVRILVENEREFRERMEQHFSSVKKHHTLEDLITIGKRELGFAGEHFNVTMIEQCELCGGVLKCDECGGPDFALHQPWCEEFDLEEEDG